MVDFGALVQSRLILQRFLMCSLEPIQTHILSATELKAGMLICLFGWAGGGQGAAHSWLAWMAMGG